MTPEEIKFQELKNSINSNSNQLEKISIALASITQTIENESKAKQVSPKNKLDGWGSSITIIVGILSGVAILFTQLRQPGNVDADTQVKLSTARKTTAESLILEKELQGSIDSLKRKGSKDVQAYNELLDDKLPKLQNVVTRLETARSQSQNQNLLYKYIIIWVIFIGLGWFFRLFHTLWSNLINILSFILTNRTRNLRDEKKRNRLFKISQSFSFLYSAPTIVEIIIDINIFFILIVPIFNETSASLGSNKNFKSISSEFSKFHIRSSIDSARSIISIDTTKILK